MCNSEQCRERLMEEQKRLQESEYESFDEEDACECGFVHFDSDGNVMGRCREEETKVYKLK